MHNTVLRGSIGLAVLLAGGCLHNCPMAGESNQSSKQIKRLEADLAEARQESGRRIRRLRARFVTDLDKMLSAAKARRDMARTVDRYYLATAKSSLLGLIDRGGISREDAEAQYGVIEENTHRKWALADKQVAVIEESLKRHREELLTMPP